MAKKEKQDVFDEEHLKYILDREEKSVDPSPIRALVPNTVATKESSSANHQYSLRRARPEKVA